MQRSDLEQWMKRYEHAWRTTGTDVLAELFTADVRYRPDPWAPAISGLDALRTFWEAERSGPDEDVNFAAQVVAVDGDVGVARAEVAYDLGTRWRNLWIVQLTADGQCSAFEEWPFAPPV
jgi:SnoaL-like protein